MTYLFKDGFAPNIWQMYDYSDSRVVSGNYLKIQSISLRYQLPRKFCNSIRMKSGYLMFTGTNLYTFANSRLQRTGPDHLGRLCDRRVDPSDLLVYAQCLILKYSPL